jgi:hypothetical protein
MDEREFLWKAMVEAVGAVWVGVEYENKIAKQPVVLFKAAADELTLTLYASALRSVADVEMAVKNYLESKRLVRVVGM